MVGSAWVLGIAGGWSAGYTWVGGKDAPSELSKNVFDASGATRCYRSYSGRGVGLRIFTIVLSVTKGCFAFGKGAEGQLGLNERRFVSAATGSPFFPPVVIAMLLLLLRVFVPQNCSWTMDRNGKVLQTAGNVVKQKQTFIKHYYLSKNVPRNPGLLEG
jgi:hypothetical protein